MITAICLVCLFGVFGLGWLAHGGRHVALAWRSDRHG